MEKLIFATGNTKKGYEMIEKFTKEGIPLELKIMDFQEPEVNDIEAVARSKVVQAYEIVKKPCFVIDSGLNIIAYPNNPGYPGSFVRRSGISENIDMLLETMKEVNDRRCVFLDCLAFYDGENVYTFFGRDEGEIIKEKRGHDNPAMRSPLWYVFKPQFCTKTLAEMTDEERLSRKDGHISAKEQFIAWYREEYNKNKQLVKK